MHGLGRIGGGPLSSSGRARPSLGDSVPRGESRGGVYPSQWIEKAVSEGWVTSRLRLPDPELRQLQPASLDLRLGEHAHPLRCSFLPGDEDVATKLERYALGRPIDLRDGALLERNRPYLIPLEEGLALPSGVRGRANPKSSVGRLDVFTRVITDRGRSFDEVREGYRGRLWLELFSRTFTVMIRSGVSLNQLRLLEGEPRLGDGELAARHADDPLLTADGEAVGADELVLSGGLFLSLDLVGGSEGFVGYKARRNSRLLDLTATERYEPDDFWEEVYAERNHRLVLEPEEFYLLISREAVRIPPDLAAEMTAYDPTAGELRTHYAGFFDPGFGYAENGSTEGSRAVLEVRAHDVPFVVEHGQTICRLVFEEMRERPEILYGEGIGSAYQGQEVMLSKYFEPGRTVSR